MAFCIPVIQSISSLLVCLYSTRRLIAFPDIPCAVKSGYKAVRFASPCRLDAGVNISLLCRRRLINPSLLIFRRFHLGMRLGVYCAGSCEPFICLLNLYFKTIIGDQNVFFLHPCRKRFMVCMQCAGHMAYAELPDIGMEGFLYF